MKQFSDLTIKSKLASLIIGISVFLSILLFFIIFSIKNIQSAKDDITSASLALSHMQTCDMMHDALHGDVFHIMSVDMSNSNEVKTVENELEEHVKIFKENIETASKLNVNADVKAAINEARPVVDSYEAGAKEIFDYLVNNYKEVKLNSNLINESNFSSNSVDKFLEFANSNENEKKKLNERLIRFEEAFSAMESAMGDATDKIRSNYVDVQKNSDKTILNSEIYIVLLILILLSTLIIFIVYLSKSLVVPITITQNSLSKIADGEIPSPSGITRKDELGNMISSLNVLVGNLENLKQFVSEVGSGNFNTNVELFGGKGDIANSLYTMRNNLNSADIKEKNRNWINTGLANFGNILRKDSLSMEELCQQIIQYIVKYLNANQGALFFINENETTKEQYWEMMACCAYEKIRYEEKKTGIKDGLLGRIYLEKEYLFFTDVPQNYVRITSGIGEATPSCLMLLPLKTNDSVVGALEIATFTPFKPHEQDFLFKIADTVASAVSSLKTNYKTIKLLETTQFQAEHMRAQEEELRQNLEELSTTQEEMQIKENGYLARIAELEAEMKKLNEKL